MPIARAKTSAMAPPPFGLGGVMIGELFLAVQHRAHQLLALDRV